MERLRALPYSGRRYEAMLDTLYATPTHNHYWPAFLEQLIGVSSSRSARLLVLDRAAHRVESSAKARIDDQAHHDYVNHFVNTCPWRPELREKPPGRLYSTYLDFSCRQKQFYQTEFYNDWARSLDIHHGVCGTIYQDRDHTIQLLVQRTKGQGPYDHHDTTWFNRLVPHIRRAINLNHETARLSWRARADGLGTHRPFMVLGPGGRIEYLCPRAEHLLANEKVLFCNGGRLVLKRHSLNLRFLSLLSGVLASAGRDWQHAGGFLPIPRPAGPPLVCLLSPLTPEVSQALLPVGGRVLLHFHVPEDGHRIDEQHVAELFDLTPAEARVARNVAEGGALNDLADHQGTSVQTVRTQLKAVFRKTGTKRQNELAALILGSPVLRPKANPPITLPHEPV